MLYGLFVVDFTLGDHAVGTLNVDGVAAVAETTQERFGHGAVAQLGHSSYMRFVVMIVEWRR